MKRLLAAFLIVSLPILSIYINRDANATNGAFKDTKHGGGTVDGVGCPPRCGIDRSINPDYMLYYNDASPEAGQYAPGECNNCHELHSSFGGIEPLPDADGDAGPDAYLLFKEYATTANYTNLCWYCHDNFVGRRGPGTGFWGYYQGRSVFSSSSHFESTNFYWPGGTSGNSGVGNAIDSRAIWPRRTRANLPTGNRGSCLNCHTPHGIKDAVANGGYDYGTPEINNYYVGADPNPGGAEMIPRQLIAREEALCLNCHDVDGTGGPGTAPDIKSLIDRRVREGVGATSISSGHAVRKYFGRHDLYKELNPLPVAGWLTRPGGPGWHIECMDCHNPHAVSKGPNDLSRSHVFQRSGMNVAMNLNRNLAGVPDLTIEPVRIGNANKGVWGVSISGALNGGDGVRHSTSYTYKQQVEFVYELCYKCHSSFGDTNINVTANSAPNGTSGSLDYNVAPSTTRGSVAGVTQPPPNVRFTDVGKEMDPDNCDDGLLTGAFAKGAIHPILAKGCNQPPAMITACTPSNPGPTPNPTNTNARWGMNCQGTVLGAPNDLSQNFVPPWTSKSFVTCVDCHLTSGPVGESISDSKGPHGSNNYFILRSVDTTISYQICANSNDNCATRTNYSYSTIGDTRVFCINCHRADIYGWLGQLNPPRRAFARVAHPADSSQDGNARSFMGPGDEAAPPRGIVCLRCHGGRILGGIHGMNLGSGSNTTYSGPQVVTGQAAGNNPGRTLLYGTVWRGYTQSAAGGTCFPDSSNASWNTCNQHSEDNASGGMSTNGTNFRYPFP